MHRRAYTSFYDNHPSQIIKLPNLHYWTQILSCRGCGFPLERPIFLCYNTKVLHPLCRSCRKCTVPDCQSKVGTSRSVILEKVLSLVEFPCEYKCEVGSMQSSTYRSHLSQCHRRPLSCRVCGKAQNFKSYLLHLKRSHRIQEMKLDRETLILDFERGQPRLQLVQFSDQFFILNFDHGVFWIELFNFEEGQEENFRVRVSGVKYPIEAVIRVLGIRNNFDPSQVDSQSRLENLTRKKFLPFSSVFPENPHHSTGIAASSLDECAEEKQKEEAFVIPPSDEEIFLLFVNYADNAEESEFSDSLLAASSGSSFRSEDCSYSRIIIREYSFHDDGVYV